jgi:hypothetical protein
MKDSTIVWLVVGLIVLYVLLKSSAQPKLTEGEYYAGTAAKVIEDLF